MSTTRCAARALPIAALLIAVLGACSDNATTTAPLTLHPRLTQVAASPVVNSLADPGTGGCDDTECTLREAMSFASGGATITFAPGLTGTITLASSSGNLYLAKSLTINGPGADVLVISGGDATRVLWVVGGTSTISGLTFTHGKSQGGDGGGIAVGNGGTTLTLRNCAVTNNSLLRSFDWGAGIANSGATVIIESCTISGNVGPAAAIYASPRTGTEPGSTTILNSTISGNSADANAIYVNAGTTMLIDHSTVTDNGVGVYSGTNSPSVTVKGSIIWGNASDDVATSYDNAFTSLGYNLIGTGNSSINFGHDFAATGDQTGVADAKLDALSLISPGTTETHQLLEGSPAIDAGVCTNIAGATLSTDQRGVSRPQGSTCDIGAFEAVVSGGTTPTFVFDLSTLPAKTFGDTAFSVVSYVSTNSSGAVTFATGSGSAGCSVSSTGTVTLTGAAIDPSACTLEASLAADATYTSAGPVSQHFHIAKAQGSVSISNIPGSATVGGSFTPAYTKSGDGTASTVSNSTGVCTVTGGVVNYIAAGSCLLQASVTEGTNHLAATGTQQSFTISLLDPGFTFDISELGTVTYGNSPFGINSFAHTNSSGYISFALGSGSVGCSVSTGGTLTITGAAIDPSHCIIEASVAADATYSGAGPISQSFNIAKASADISINNMPASGTIGGSFTPTYATSGDGTRSTVSNDESVCTVSSGIVNFVGAGTCRLQAWLTEGSNYLGATGSEQTFTISAPATTFSFDLSTLPAKTFGADSFSVAGYITTNSTGAVSFALATSSVGCSVTSAGMVTIASAAVDPSHCVISASLAEDAPYAAAGPIEQSFNIAKAAGSVSIDNMPSSATVGGQFTPTFTQVGDGIASVVSLTTDVCTVTDGVVHFVTSGTCRLRGSVTEGTNHLAATGAQESVNVLPALGIFSSSCTYTINAKNNQRLVTVIWENANPGVTKIELVDGRVVTKQLAPTAAGSWSTNVKTGTPTYGLWGGTSRRDATSEHVAAGTACSLIQ